MNPTTTRSGESTPTAAARKPSVTAMLYAGAVWTMPSTVLPISPIAPRRRPLSAIKPCSVESARTGVAEAIGVVIRSLLLCAVQGPRPVPAAVHRQLELRAVTVELLPESVHAEAAARACDRRCVEVEHDGQHLLA